MEAERPKIVISAVNLVEGGTLSVLQDCLAYAAAELSGRYQVIALVNRKSLFNLPQVDFIEFPYAKRSWFLRLYHEYWLFRQLSKKLKAELWLSLHDMTPNVMAKRRAVYCHNPAPFYSISLREAWIDPVFAMFVYFYRWVYRVNIQKNDFVIVQQDWMRQKFHSMFGIRNIVVAHPEASKHLPFVAHTAKDKNVCRFFYPAFPRVFKNFEVICEASKKLMERGFGGFEVLMTIDGSESRYAKSIVERYGNVRPLKFIGRQSREAVYGFYQSADCLIFPSKLETWGLPITEFKLQQRPILVANLEYAQETVGAYNSARFFESDDADELADCMLSVIDNAFSPSKNIGSKYIAHYTKGWPQLFDCLLANQLICSSSD